MHQLSVWFIYFIIYSIMGWIAETIYCSVLERHFVERGFLRGPLCPIYGTGAVIILWLLQPYVDSWILLFVIGFFLTSALEYLTSYAMEKVFKMRWWDYSKHFLNINGRVCLLNSTMFGILVLILVKGIHPWIEQRIASLPNQLLYLFVLAFASALLIDLIVSIKATFRLKEHLEKFKEAQEHFKEEFEKYQREFVERLTEGRDDIMEQLEESKDNIKETLETKKDELLVESKERMQELRLRLTSSEWYILRSFPNLKPTKINMAVALEQLRDEVMKARKNRKYQ